MASQRAKRKRRSRSGSSAPRAVPSQRREVRAERTVTAERERKRSQSFGTRGERPPSPFGGLPISEIAIFAGLVSIIVWFINRGTAALVVGSVVCAFGVLEVTCREHFSGYRSHTILLAAVPAVALEAGLFAAGVRPRERALLLVAVVPVFALGFWWLRKRFIAARQARIARMPGA